MANTVDVLGDDLLSDKIIDKSITELVDDAQTSIGSYAFKNCSRLTSVDFPLVTSISNYAFNACTGLTSVDFPLVTYIGSYAFESCTHLTSVDFPLVTSITPYAFNTCTGLASVDFPLATSIGVYAFRSCVDLASVDFPLVTSIGAYAFERCTGLTTLILRNTQEVATLSNTNAFSGAPNVIIYVPDELVDDYKAATNWSTYADRINGLSELPETE